MTVASAAPSPAVASAPENDRKSIGAVASLSGHAVHADAYGNPFVSAQQHQYRGGF